MAADGGIADMELNRANIEALEDICEAMDLMHEHSIPYDNLLNLEDFKERCICHLKKMTCGSVRDNIEHSMMRSAVDDKAKTDKLLCYYKDIQDILKIGAQYDDPTVGGPILTLIKLLKEDGTTEDMLSEIKTKIETLQIKDSRILVSGETNAGKSSCLNLLFGEKILSEAAVSSTSVMTSVSNEGRRFAQVFHTDGTRDDIKDLEKLDKILFHRERGEHDISEVKININSSFLKNTLVLVDSPGIGECEFLEDLLINYIKNHEIHGFAYVIKTDNAGGVQEDRLINLLRIVMKQQKEKKNGKYARPIDPRAAIFICNRLDNVELSERDKVKKHVVDQLGKIWPNLLESQVVFFSCHNAIRDLKVDPEYISDGFQDYLEGLRNLYFLATEKRIRENYRWIEKILRRSLFHLKTFVRQLDLSERDLKRDMKETEDKLYAFKEESDSVISNLKRELNELTHDICKQLAVYLNTPMVRTRLISCWTENDLPKAEDGSWAFVKAKVEEAFYTKLGHLLQEWDTDHQKIKEHERNMLADIQFQLQLQQREMEKIEYQIEGDVDSGLGCSRGSRKGQGLNGRKLSIGDIFSRRLSGVDKSLGLTQMPEHSHSLQVMLSLPFKQRFVKNYREKYAKQPVKYAQHRSKKLLVWLLEGKKKGENGLLPFVKNLLARPYRCLDILEKSVPTFIRVTDLQMRRFKECHEKDRQYQSEYLKLMESFEQLKSSLRVYGEGYIFVDDFKRDEIQVAELTGTQSTQTEFKVSTLLAGQGSEKQELISTSPQGLWSVYQDGDICRSNERTPITIRVYLPSSRIENTVPEVAKLRSLNVNGMFLAEFLGIHHTDAPTPAFIYEGRYQSLRSYLKTEDAADVSLESFSNTKRIILLQLAGALDYLKEKKMVHMELTQDTVTVTETGEIKLTGACLSRKATLPTDMKNIKVGDFCYLAPEVLNGQPYTSAADIYSFGLLILEVLLDGFIAFKEEKKWTMIRFIQDENHAALLALDDWPKLPIDVTRLCLENNETQRAEVAYIKDIFLGM